MDYAAAIAAEIAVLRHLGYTEPDVARVIGIYSGYEEWRGLSENQQRRLAADLKRHAGIARRWHFALAGGLKSTDIH
jgi:hypothetical protein